jgi:hypothetical protein
MTRSRLARTASALLVTATVACCSGPSPNAVPTGASAVAGGCASTPLYRGASPAWTRNDGGPTSLLQATAHKGRAAAFIFGNPLRAGHPQNPDNKILWVVRLPREGSELTISGHPVGASAPTVTLTESANAGPGEIYPSIVDVPKPGCWQFALGWNGHEDTIELKYS